MSDGTSRRQLALGLLFGVAFGFLLQKGGVAKFEVLVGALRLQDFTVFKVMLTAILVGSVGFAVLERRGLVERHVQPFRPAANIGGGLLFGAGFGLAAYCPGTGAAALGQGNFDAIAMIVGMMAGSWLYAESSGPLERWKERRSGSRLTLPDLLGSNRRTPFHGGRFVGGRFLGGFAAALVIALLALEAFAT